MFTDRKKLFFSAAFALVAAAFLKKRKTSRATGSLEVELSNFAGDAPLVFGTYYKTEAGDSVQFSTFNYFDSNFVLIKSDGTEHVVPRDLAEPPAFHLFVDVLEVFKSSTAIKVADHPTSHGDAFSEFLVNNYLDMFALDHVHNH